MATKMSLSSVLADFTTAVSNANQSLPESALLLPPPNGITLLDTKTELFLSYLQTLALRNLEVLRSCKRHVEQDDDDELDQNDKKVRDGMVKKLVEHRVYLEKGIRPLEDRIKYQVDKVVRAADDEARLDVQKAGAKLASEARASKPDAEASSDEEEAELDGDEVDPLSYRPNPASALQQTQTRNESRQQDSKSKTSQDGVYRPPRISATSMPTTERREKAERAPRRSATMDEYISTELSTAPTAEPSIGSTITDRGRKTKSAKQLADESARREYEETHLTRLPLGSKKDQRKKEGRASGYGGEEWRGLGESLDRIGEVTRKKGKEGALGRSRKRAVEDGPRDDGVGAAFEVKRRRFEKKSGR